MGSFTMGTGDKLGLGSENSWAGERRMLVSSDAPLHMHEGRSPDGDGDEDVAYIQ